MANRAPVTTNYSTETKLEWRRRLDHRLSNIERLLGSIKNAVLAQQTPDKYDPDEPQGFQSFHEGGANRYGSR